MLATRPRGRTLALTAASVLALAGTLLSVPSADAGGSPTNAAKVFRWGNAAWHDEFHSSTPDPMWQTSPAGAVTNRHGMLTLAASSGTTTASVPGQAQQYGRWEARIRSSERTHGGKHYRVALRLVPVHDQTCGRRDIVISQYSAAGDRVHVFLRNNDLQFRYGQPVTVRDNSFHTYAVEVTPTHISWFMDTKVIMTERRPRARTGETYIAQFDLTPPASATAGTKMNTTWMQMDWMRYYTLARPDALSIDAPQAHRRTDSVPGCSGKVSPRKLTRLVG